MWKPFLASPVFSHKSVLTHSNGAWYLLYFYNFICFKISCLNVIATRSTDSKKWHWRLKTSINDILQRTTKWLIPNNYARYLCETVNRMTIPMLLSVRGSICSLYGSVNVMTRLPLPCGTGFIQFTLGFHSVYCTALKGWLCRYCYLESFYQF